MLGDGIVTVSVCQMLQLPAGKHMPLSVHLCSLFGVSLLDPAAVLQYLKKYYAVLGSGLDEELILGEL